MVELCAFYSFMNTKHRVHRAATATCWRTSHHENQPSLVRVGGGVHAHPLHYIYHHVQSCGVRSLREGRYTHPVSTLPLCVLCGSKLLVCVWASEINLYKSDACTERKWSLNCVKTHERFKVNHFVFLKLFLMAGGVPARTLPRPQDAGQATQRQQKDQHDQVLF
jgi:hypothetical protein